MMPALPFGLNSIAWKFHVPFILPEQLAAFAPCRANKDADAAKAIAVKILQVFFMTSPYMIIFPTPVHGPYCAIGRIATTGTPALDCWLIRRRRSRIERHS